MARGLKFRILKVDGLYYYLKSEDKGADQLHGHREADLRFCFRICKRFVSRCGSNDLQVSKNVGSHALYGIHIYIWDLLGITVTAKLICFFVFFMHMQNFCFLTTRIKLSLGFHIYIDFTRDNSHTYFLRPCPSGIDMTPIHIFDTKT